MHFSTRSRYGLRAMIDIALYGSEGPVSMRAISERQGVSFSYLEQVFNSLRKHGLIKAVRGPSGGYILVRPANQIPIGDILRALDGPFAPVDCVDPSCDANPCERKQLCISRFFWEKLQDNVNSFMDSMTLQQLIDHSGTANPVYFI